MPGCRLADARVERFLAATARAQKAAEYCRFRRYADDGDLDGDGKDDFAVVFHLEAKDSNRVDHWVAVFPSRDPGRPVRLLLAEADAFLPDGISVEGGKLVVTTLEYRDADPHCCPTGKGRALLALRGGKLVLEEHAAEAK